MIRLTFCGESKVLDILIRNPYKFCILCFKFQGPDTIRCEKTASEITSDTGKNKIKFEFTAGSLQMPILKFSTPDVHIDEW